MNIKASTATLLAAIVILSIIEGAPTIINSSTETTINHKIFYYLDYAYIVLTTNNTKGYFESPINYSDGTLNQTVYLRKFGGNVSIVNSTPPYQIEISNGSKGFIVLEVVQEYRNSSKFIQEILSNPQSLRGTFHKIPKNISSKYLLKPLKIVNEYVKPSFEKWLENKGYSINNVSKAFLAVEAAQFIYGQYFIKYNASGIPRPIDYVIEHRTGDCDDMSRVLLNLLWSYGVPGKMEYSYVYLSFNATFNIEGSYLTFVNAGPHAYVVAYIPTLGWVSLDFLAGALIKYPSIITGETTDTNVTSGEVEEIKKELSQYRYAEITAIYQDKDIPQNIYEAIESDTIGQYLFNFIKPSVILLNATLNNSTTASKSITKKQNSTITSIPITTTTSITISTSTSTTTPSPTSHNLTPIPALSNISATATTSESLYTSTFKELTSGRTATHSEYNSTFIILIILISFAAAVAAITLVGRR